MNENEIMKPTTLLKEDFEKNLINLCNSSGLPFLILEYILRDVYMEVKGLARKQYESDLINYMQSQSKNDEQPLNLTETEE